MVTSAGTESGHRLVGSALGAAVALILGTMAAVLVTAGWPPSPVQASDAITTISNVPYSNASNLNDLDIVEPSPLGQNLYAVVLIHGGGYTSGSKSDLTTEADEFAEAGFVAFNINYRLDGYPNESNDAMTAVAWVRSNAATYGVNPSDIGVLGTSAGGTLAAMVATEGAADGVPVRAVASWSGPMDLAALVNESTPGSYANEHPETYVGGCSPSQCPATYAAASPVDHVSASTCPMLIANSTDEEIPLSQAEEMDNALKSAGVPQVLDVIPGTQHAEAYNAPEISPTIEFFTQYLGAAATAPAGQAAQPPPVAVGSADPAPAGSGTPSATTTTGAPATTTTSTSGTSTTVATAAGVPAVAHHAGSTPARNYLAVVAAVVALAIVGILAGILESRNRNRKRLLLSAPAPDGAP
jgi:acetyl esterase